MKFKVDFKSLKFRLLLYFGLFAAILMIILWFLQIFFLNTYYKDMKIRETQGVATFILNEYGDENQNEKIAEINSKNDMFILIKTIDDKIVYSTDYYTNKNDSEEAASNSVVYYNRYSNEIVKIKDQLFESGSYSVSTQLKDLSADISILAYATFLDDTEGQEVILFIFSPLFPVESTVSILANQLIYITLIAMFIAFLLAFYLSRKITNPLTNVTETAEDLAKGKYGIIFEGGHYSEIIKLADTLTYTSLELAHAVNLQKDLIANVSHDLRTPLTMVKSYAEMIRDLSGDNPEKREEHLQVIISEADRLNALVTDFLELSKMQSGQTIMNKTRFSIKSTIDTILESYKLLVEEKDYRIVFTSYGTGLVFADEEKIKQILTNLINNALKFCGNDRTVEINMKESEETVRIEVIDHGIGIPKRDLSNIWDRYYKASTNRKRGVGTGLGLSIVKEILVLHDASFGVSSELRHGSTFWFELKKWRYIDEHGQK